MTDSEQAEENDDLNDDFLRFDESDDDSSSGGGQATGGKENSKKRRREEDGDGGAARNQDGSTTQDGRPADEPPPWMEMASQGSAFEDMHPMIQLHNEIVGFCNLMEPRPEELEKRQELVERFTKLVKKTFGDDADVEVFGSQVTGLCLPTSDIDIAIQIPSDETDGDNAAAADATDEDILKSMKAKESPLVRLGSVLQTEWKDELSYLEVIENTRVPLVKFIMASSNIPVDVCFNQDTGPSAAKLVKQYMEIMPPLRPLTFVLKYFLAARALNQPYSGGVGSFMLQMMILSFLQHREREAIHYRNPCQQNLGAMLIDFLVLYSTDFNYITTGFTVRFDGMYFPKGASDRKEFFWQESRAFSLAIENPLEPTADVGKPSFRMQTVQRAFEVAYKLLLHRMYEPKENSPSLLACLLPTTDEMVERRTMNNTNEAANVIVINY